MNPTTWNSYLFLAALVPAISLVYAATRFEDRASIILNAVKLMFTIFGSLFLVTALLLAINAW